jgi:hypothetical protein
MVDVAQLVEPRIVIPAVVGSSPIVHPTPRRNRGLLAQLVEQLTLNQLVIGSSPIRPTTFLLENPRSSLKIRDLVSRLRRRMSRV